MLNFKTFIIHLLLLVSTLSLASETCQQEAKTQAEMNQCSAQSFTSVDKELNRVYSQIRSLYKDDSVFLEKLKLAQTAWIKSRDVDFALYYPHEKEPSYYGSVFSMCAGNLKTEITLQRINFLKQWVTGREEGDVCAGSIKWSSELNN